MLEELLGTEDLALKALSYLVCISFKPINYERFTHEFIYPFT